MNFRNSFTFLLLLSRFSIMGQVAGFNFIPIEFDSLEPVWSHVIYDSTIINHQIDSSWTTYDGYSHVRATRDVEKEFLVHEGYLYLVSMVYYDRDIGGAIIEKLDMETGDLIWQNLFDPRTTIHREFIHRSFIRNDKLVLLNIQATPDSKYLVGRGGVGHLKIREYDLVTGALLFESIPDVNNTNTKIIGSSYYRTVQLFTNETADTIEVIKQSTTIEEGQILIIDTLDRQGKYLNATDTLLSGFDFNWPESWLQQTFKFLKTQEDSLAWLIHYSPATDEADPAFAQIRTLGKYGYRTIDIDISEFEDLYGLAFMNSTSNEFVLLAGFSNNGLGLLFVNRHTGEINRFLNFPRPKPFNDWESLQIVSGETNFAAELLVDSVNIIEVYQTNGDEFNLKRNISLKNKKYSLVPDDMELLESGDFLLSFFYTETRGINPKGRFNAIMRLKPKDLGYTHAEEVTPSFNLATYFAIFPNPVKESITIQSEVFSTEVQCKIFDISGHLIISESFYKIKSLDMSNLITGTYICQIISNGHIETHRVIKI